MTPRQKAAVRAKLAAKPSMDQMRRIADAMATPGVAVCHEKGTRGSWSYDIYDCVFDPGKLQVNVWQGNRNNAGYAIVANLEAAHSWMKTWTP